MSASDRAPEGVLFMDAENPQSFQTKKPFSVLDSCVVCTEADGVSSMRPNGVSVAVAVFDNQLVFAPRDSEMARSWTKLFE